MTSSLQKDSIDKKYRDLPYRPCVGIVLFNRDSNVWVGQRVPKPGDKLENAWQMPQGGIDNGETPVEAAFRELREETGIESAEIISETPEWLTYDLPEHLLGVSWGGKYRGQKQKWFALRFSGNDQEVDLNKHQEPEFSAWRWVPLESLPELIVPFKKPIYEELVRIFSRLSGSELNKS